VNHENRGLFDLLEQRLQEIAYIMEEDLTNIIVGGIRGRRQRHLTIRCPYVPSSLLPSRPPPCI
jgi:hypothetical protein